MQDLLAYPDARVFLANALPWGTDWINLHYKTDKKTAKGQSIWAGRAFKELDDAMYMLGVYNKSDYAKDIYCCMSSQLRSEDKISRNDKPYHAAIRSAANATSLKSLFIDVDVKEGAYPDTSTALGAVLEFVGANNLPPPSSIVYSGTGGVHVHWILNEALPRDEWLVLAHALASMVDKHGLKCDTGCTRDSARILRIPQTLNWKTDPPSPTKLLLPKQNMDMPLYMADVMNDRLKSFIGLTAIPRLNQQVVGLPRRTPITDNAGELGGGINERERPSLDVIAGQCGFIRDTLADRGAANNNPLWFATANIAYHCQGGYDDLVRMSDGHADYDETATQNLYTRVSSEKKGFIGCGKINAPQCAECPLFKEARSPLNFGYVLEGEILTTNGDVLTVELPPTKWGHLPFGYNHGPDGHIERLVTIGEAGASELRQLCKYPMYNGRTEDAQGTLVFDTIVGHETRTVRMMLTEIMSKDLFAKTLAKFALAVKEDQFKLLKDFLVAWTHKLQDIKDRVVTSYPFGWAWAGNKCIGFSYGGAVWTNGPELPAASQDPNLGVIYKPTGELEQWFEAAKMITTQGRPDMDVLIAASFGAPLVTHMGAKGSLISVYGPSGWGKSTAMDVALAIWGNPVNGKQSLDDTETHIALKMGQLRALPMFWDELKSMHNAESFVRMLFRLGQGSDKGRATRDLGIRTKSEWQTLLVTAGNNSLIDVVNDQITNDLSGIYRVFEFEVSPLNPGGDGGKIQRQVDRLRRNYGHAGLHYSKFLGANAERVQEEVSIAYDTINKRLGKVDAERFWITSITACVMGARYANELGLTDINEEAMFRFLASTILRMRRIASGSTLQQIDSDETIADIIGQFLTANAVRKTIITNTMPVTKGPFTTKVAVANNTDKFDEVWVHRSQNPGMILLAQQPFNVWLKKNKIPQRQTTQYMLDKMGAVKCRRYMAYGTPFQTAPTWCYELDLSKEGFETL